MKYLEIESLNRRVRHAEGNTRCAAPKHIRRHGLALASLCSLCLALRLCGKCIYCLGAWLALTWSRVWPNSLNSALEAYDLGDSTVRGSLSAWSCASRPRDPPACCARANARSGSARQRLAGQSLFRFRSRACRYASRRSCGAAAPVQRRGIAPARVAAASGAATSGQRARGGAFRPPVALQPLARRRALTRATSSHTRQASSRAWTRSCRLASSTRWALTRSRGPNAVFALSAHAQRPGARPPTQVVTSIASSPASLSTSPIGPLTGAQAARTGASVSLACRRSRLFGAQTPALARR
jgi:hypothetical protein